MPAHSPTEQRPTIAEILQHHDELGTASRKEVGLLLKLERATTDRMFLGDRERWFSVANDALRTLPEPLADDIASYLTRSSPYQFTRTDRRPTDDAMGATIKLDQTNADLLAAVHAGGNRAAIIAAANHVKRLADQIIAAAQSQDDRQSRARAG